MSVSKNITAKLFVECDFRSLDWETLDDGVVLEICFAADTVPLRIRTHPLGEFILETSTPINTGGFVLQYRYRQMDTPIYFLSVGNLDYNFKLVNSHNTDLHMITSQARILSMSAKFTVETCE